jgi:hypothetical protein
VAPQASSLHNQPFFESSIADPHGAKRWYAVLLRTIGIVSDALVARPDGPPKLPGAGSVGPLAYPMRRFQGKGSQERGQALKAFLAQIPDLYPSRATLR